MAASSSLGSLYLKRSQGGHAALPEVYSESRSELQLHIEPAVERVLEVDRGPEIGVGERRLEAQVAVLIDERDRHRVGDIEEVGAEVKGPALRHLARVFPVQVDGAGDRRASQASAAALRNFTLVAVRGMVGKYADRCSALNVHTGSYREALGHAVVKGVTHEEAGDVMPFGIERANGKLIAEQVHDARAEIEQRADAGIGLAIVIAERAFIVSAQIGQTIVEAHQPAFAEAPVEFELARLVIADRIDKAVGNAVRIRNQCTGVGLESARREAGLLPAGEWVAIDVGIHNLRRRARRPERLHCGNRFVG